MAGFETNANKDEVMLEHREIESFQHHPHTPAVEVALHHDQVAPEAIGGLYEEMPKGYYWSKNFLGTMIVSNFQTPPSPCICLIMTDFSRRHVLPKSVDT